MIRPSGPRGELCVRSIPARRAGFTGRDGLLADLGAALRRQGRVAVAAAVTGMGGLGKTSAAIEYAHRHAGEFDIVWWVPSEDPALVPERLAELARALDLAAATDPAGIAVARLHAELARRRRWLLVFDNAEDPSALERLIPAAETGQVLVTSRNPDWRSHATTIGLDVFDRAESIALLHARVPALDDGDAGRIADAVGDLPLAVDQAAALLADTTLTVEQYLQQLRERADRVFGQPPTGPYPREVAAAFTLGFDQLATENPDALDLLTLLAWFGPEPVPLDLLTDHPELLTTTNDTGPDRAGAGGSPDPGGERAERLAAAVRDPLVLAGCTRRLQRRAVITLGAGTLQLHRVPAALLRARAGHGPSPDAWATTAGQLLRAALPVDVFHDLSTWPAWHRLLPHVLAVTDSDRAVTPGPATASWLLDRAGSYLHTRGELQAARPLLERAHTLQRGRSGDDHPGTLNSANNLATVLYDLGEHEQARDLYEDTLDRQRRVLGDDHTDALNSASNLANVLSVLGEHGQARELHEDILDRRRPVLGDDHPETLNSANSLATVLQVLGEHGRARELHEDTLDRRRRVLGDDHPDTLNSANNLATVLLVLGEHEQARDLYEDTRDRLRRVLGDNHPSTLTSANNLAGILYDLGEHEQARDLYEDTRDRQRRILGDDHPDTLNSASNLATVLRVLGEHGRARALHEDTLARRRRILGADHPDTLTSANNLAVVRYHLGEHEQARELHEDTLDRRRRVLGDDHPATLNSINNLKIVRRALGEDEQSK